MATGTARFVSEIRLGFMLGQIDTLLRSRMHETARSFDLSVDEWTVLAFVHTQTCDPHGLHEMRPDECSVLPPELGRFLVDLERKHLLRLDSDDRSLRSARLTRRGHQVVTGILSLNRTLMIQATSGMTAGDITSAVALMERIYTNLA